LDRTELARLKAENAELGRELEALKAGMAEGAKALTQTTERLEELRRPMTADIQSSALRAELKSGEVVVTGGYALPDGRRLYAFAKPVVEQVNGKATVMIQGRILSMDESAVKAVGLDGIATNAANTIQHGEVWLAEEETAVMKQLEMEKGVDVYTTPRVTVNSGSSGSFNLTGGATVDIKLRVSPVLREDGKTMDFEVRFENAPTPNKP
jgi:ribosomal protein L18E